MECNEQTELTSKIETYSDREQADSSVVRMLEGTGIEQKDKELMQMDHSMMIVVKEEVVEEEDSIRWINSNKKTQQK